MKIKSSRHLNHFFKIIFPNQGVLTAPSWAGHFRVELPLNFAYPQENEKSLGPNRKAAGPRIHSGV